MKHKALITLVFSLLAKLTMRIVQLYAIIISKYRSAPTRQHGVPRIITIDGITLTETPISIDGYQHRVTQAGNPDAQENQTMVLMGGIPTDASETFYWLVAELCKRDSSLRCVILHQPYMEEHTTVLPTDTRPGHHALSLPFSDHIDLSNERVDTRYDHKNQAVTAYAILSVMKISKAHFVGHDRGAVIFDYLIGNHPDMALSYSRGAQLWDYYEDSWAGLAPELIVGPPHRFMAIPWQCRLLFFAVIVLGGPIKLLSSGFIKSAENARRGTEAYDRWTHLSTLTLKASDKNLLKVKHTFMQTDCQQEILNRGDLKKTSVPIMQFQGEDEFALNEKGVAISDQPYFGRYNLFPNDVEDLYPDSVFQDETIKRNELLEERPEYSLLKLKPSARFNRFALIPGSAHFHIIENPQACTSAIMDFINDK